MSASSLNMYSCIKYVRICMCICIFCYIHLVVCVCGGIICVREVYVRGACVCVFVFMCVWDEEESRGVLFCVRVCVYVCMYFYIKDVCIYVYICVYVVVFMLCCVYVE